jgi:hypothetical protein
MGKREYERTQAEGHYYDLQQGQLSVWNETKIGSCETTVQTETMTQSICQSRLLPNLQSGW